MKPLHELDIVDSAGRIRIRLSVDAAGDRPQLEFFDKDGLSRLAIGLSASDQGQISLLSESGQPLVGIGISEVQGVGLGIYDAAGRPAIAVRLASNGDRHIEFVDAQGVKWIPQLVPMSQGE